MKPNPKIVSAAVKRGSSVWEGRRHSDAIMAAVSAGCQPPITQYEQGFVDEDGRFWRRFLAREMAIRAGQISKDHEPPLTSEDLW
jgi:hypothetical protein